MDVISNMLITIKNGGNAGKTVVEVPYSKLKAAVAALLFKEGYIASYAKKTKKGGDVLEIGIAYDENSRQTRIRQVKRISKPSCRVYYSVKDLMSVRNGMGLLVVSTPKGVMSGMDARKEHVGGEALFEIW